MRSIVDAEGGADTLQHGRCGICDTEIIEMHLDGQTWRPHIIHINTVLVLFGSFVFWIGCENDEVWNFADGVSFGHLNFINSCRCHTRTQFLPSANKSLYIGNGAR